MQHLAFLAAAPYLAAQLPAVRWAGRQAAWPLGSWGWGGGKKNQDGQSGHLHRRLQKTQARRGVRRNANTTRGRKSKRYVPTRNRGVGVNPQLYSIGLAALLAAVRVHPKSFRKTKSEKEVMERRRTRRRRRRKEKEKNGERDGCIRFGARISGPAPLAATLAAHADPEAADAARANWQILQILQNFANF